MSTQTPAAKALSMNKALVLALGIVAITVAPALIMLAVTYMATAQVQAAATWASLPAIAGIAATALGGRRFAVIAAIVSGMLAPLCIVSGISPVSGAALMGLMAITVGRLSRFGLHKSAVLYPVMMSWAVIDPPVWGDQTIVNRLDQTYQLWMVAIFFVGAVVPALVLPLLMRKRHARPLQAYSRSDAVPYTVTITVLVTVATFVVLDNPRFYAGAFLIAAILILAPIGNAETLRPTIIRVLGTLAGSVFVLLIAAKADSLAIIYLFGVVFVVIALVARFAGHAWLYYVFMMPATASLNATTLTQVGQLGEQRLIDNVVGGLLVLLAAAATIGYSNWATRHGQARDDDEEAKQLAAVPPASPTPTQARS